MNSGPRRPYASERRRERAQQTRSRVLDSAAALFEEHGFDGASVTAIAERAGVSAETVYARFGSKRAILGELAARAVRGEDPRRVTEQSGPRAVVEERDPRAQLRLFSDDVVRRLERVAPILDVVAGAARSEPGLAELLERAHADRRRNLRTLVDALMATGPLRLPRAEAVDTVWALASPELFQLLVRVRGWSSRRYRDWLFDTLSTQLLGR